MFGRTALDAQVDWRPAVHKSAPLISRQTAFRKLASLRVRSRSREYPRYSPRCHGVYPCDLLKIDADRDGNLRPIFLLLGYRTRATRPGDSARDTAASLAENHLPFRVSEIIQRGNVRRSFRVSGDSHETPSGIRMVPSGGIAAARSRVLEIYLNRSFREGILVGLGGFDPRRGLTRAHLPPPSPR